MEDQKDKTRASNYFGQLQKDINSWICNSILILNAPIHIIFYSSYKVGVMSLFDTNKKNVVFVSPSWIHFIADFCLQNLG